MYLIDTDIVISYLKNRQETVSLIRQIKKPNLSTSIICVGEVVEGLTQEKVTFFIKAIQEIEIFNLNLAVIIKFADIRRQLRKTGKLLDNFDILIAATCIVNDLILITGNHKHFNRVPGLKIFVSKQVFTNQIFLFSRDDGGITAI